MFVAILAILAIVAVSNVTGSRHDGRPANSASSDRLTIGLAYGALAWTLIVTAALLVLPAYSGTQISTTSNGPPVITTTRQSVLEHEGRSVLFVLAVPVALAVVGAVRWSRHERRMRIGAGVLLAMGCFVSAASIGMFYMPAPIALIAAGLRTRTAAVARRLVDS